MSVDKIITEALGDKAKEFTIEEYKYEEMLEYIEKKNEEKLGKTRNKLLSNMRKVVAALHIKDFAEIAAVILIILAVPVMVKLGSDTVKSSITGKETSEIGYASVSTTNNIDAKTVDLKQAIAGGSVVLATNLNTGGLQEVYNIEKLDKFIENSRIGQRDSIRIYKFSIDRNWDKLINSIMDLNYDGSRIEAISYDLYSDKTTYKAENPIYFSKIARTETMDGIRYALCEKAEDADNMGVGLLSYEKSLKNNTDVEENYVEKEQNLAELKLSPEAVNKYLMENNYEITPNTEAQAIILLPKSFDVEKGTIKIGELLKDRNEKSKMEANLDFSTYLGKTVYMYTAIVRKDNSEDKQIEILACSEKVIGLWTYPPINEYESRQRDYDLFITTIGADPLSTDKQTENPTQVQVNPDAALKYLTENNYEIIPNSGAGEVIILPFNFNAEKNGIKIGEMLKDWNEKSKSEAKLDFSMYLGKRVYAYTAALSTGDSPDKEIIILSFGDQVIGQWTDLRIQESESRQSDFILLIQALKP
jgi:hypothetical protein